MPPLVAVPSGSVKQKVNSPKMVIRDSAGLRLVVPLAPREVEYDQNGIDWQESPRPGRMPVLRVGAQKPRRVTMTFVFYNKRHHSVLAYVGRMIGFSKRDRHLTISYSSMEKGVWVIADLSYRVIMRNLGNTPYHVEMTVTFQEQRTDQIVPGPIVSKRSPKPRRNSKKRSGSRTYTVKRGDTLWDISDRYYGTGLKWRRIADANGVKNPRLLQIGKVLRIPS